MEHLVRAVKKAGLDTTTFSTFAELPEGAIHSLVVHGTQAIDTWRALRGLVETTKHWPVLLGPRDETDQILERFEEDDSASEILRRADELPPDPALLAKRRRDKERQAMKEYAQTLGKENPVLKIIESMAANTSDERKYPTGPWPKKVTPSNNWTVPFDVLSEEPLAEVLVALVPTTTSWHVPAYLRFGSWNSCPSPKITSLS